MKLAIGAYVWHELPTVYLKPYGATWLGYPLGTVGAVLTVCLLLLGASDEPGRNHQHGGKDLSGGLAYVLIRPAASSA
jgi:hypothetical protein